MPTDKDLPSKTGLREQLLFLAFLIPTFVVLAAAAVSLAQPDPTAALQAPQMVMACEPCQPDNAEAP
jgi:hypothetical protein